jgi:hypothetical protein
MRALVIDASAVKKLDDVALVSTEDDANTFCVKVLRNLRVEEPSENDTSAEGVVLPAIWSLSVGAVTPRPILPAAVILNTDVVAPTADVEDDTSKRSLSEPNGCMIEKRAEGVVVPTPTFPLARIVKSEDPDDEATLKSPRLEVDVAWMLKTKLDEVALIPVNTPLSMSVEVPRVVEVSQRVAYPNAPPCTVVAASPRDDVATHFVLVPVVWRIIPRVPVELVVS